MNQISKYTIWVIFFVLIAVNIYVFLNSLKLSDKINLFEREIKSIHQENLGLENKIDEIDSLQYATSLAAQLDFTQKAQPTFLQNLKFARSQ